MPCWPTVTGGAGIGREIDQHSLSLAKVPSKPAASISDGGWVGPVPLAYGRRGEEKSHAARTGRPSRPYTPANASSTAIPCGHTADQPGRASSQPLPPETARHPHAYTRTPGRPRQIAHNGQRSSAIHCMFVYNPNLHTGTETLEYAMAAPLPTHPGHSYHERARLNSRSVRMTKGALVPRWDSHRIENRTRRWGRGSNMIGT